MASDDAVESSIDRLRRLYGFMEARWFVAGRDELIEAGFRASQIANWRRSGRLITVLRGTYSYGRDIETRESAWRAALNAAGETAALTGRSACELWGIVTPRGPIPKLIEVAVTVGESRRLEGKSRALRGTTVGIDRRDRESEDTRRKDGFPVVRPALALIDLAVKGTERDIYFAFLNACLLGRFKMVDVDYCLRRGAGRRGFKKLRRLLQNWVPELGHAKSVFEGRAIFVWADRHRDLPMPLVNARVFGYEVDLYWPEQRLAVELDGRAFHRGRVQHGIDEAKTRALEAEGLTVRRITYAEFDADPAATIDGIAMRVSKSEK